MKIYSHYIFTVLGNVFDNTGEWYFNSDDNTVTVFLDLGRVNKCIGTDNHISDEYFVVAKFNRIGLVNIYAEKDEYGADRMDLIDFDDLFEYLE